MPTLPGEPGTPSQHPQPSSPVYRASRKRGSRAGWPALAPLSFPGPGYIPNKPGPATQETSAAPSSTHPPSSRVATTARWDHPSPISSPRPSSCSFCHKDPSQAGPDIPNSSGLRSLLTPSALPPEALHPQWQDDPEWVLSLASCHFLVRRPGLWSGTVRSCDPGPYHCGQGRLGEVTTHHISPSRFGHRLPCPTSGLGQFRAHPRSLDKCMGHPGAVKAKERQGTRGWGRQGQDPGPEPPKTWAQDVLPVICPDSLQ